MCVCFLQNRASYAAYHDSAELQTPTAVAFSPDGVKWVEQLNAWPMNNTSITDSDVFWSWQCSVTAGYDRELRIWDIDRPGAHSAKYSLYSRKHGAVAGIKGRPLRCGMEAC